MVANRTIKQGEIIITEEPVLTVDMRMTDEESQVTIMKQFEKLKTSVKRKVEELCDNQPDGDENQKIVPAVKNIPAALMEFIDEDGAFDTTKYFNTFLDEMYEVINGGELELPEGLKLTTKYTPCDICCSHEDITPQDVRCKEFPLKEDKILTITPEFWIIKIQTINRNIYSLRGRYTLFCKMQT